MNAARLKSKVAKLRGEYPAIWRCLTSGGLTSVDASDKRLTLNLPTRCSDLEKKLGVTVERKPIKLASGKRVKHYSYRGCK